MFRGAAHVENLSKVQLRGCPVMRLYCELLKANNPQLDNKIKPHKLHQNLAYIVI